MTQEMSRPKAEAEAQQAEVLAVVKVEFDEQLASLQASETRDKIDAVLDLRGDLTKLPTRPKAGHSF